MPKIVSEISSGAQFQRSSENGRNLADAQTRVFRILLNEPGEVVNPQTVCDIRIGDRHPVNTNIYCVSWDVKFEGDSRTVMVVTFNYQSTPSSQGQDRNDQPPDIRPANWSTSTTIAEVPAYSWIQVGQDNQSFGLRTAPVNPAGDRYDGVSKYDAIVTITVEQYCQTDPTKDCQWAGSVNLEQITFGSLVCQTGSVLFRGVSSKPTVETWGDDIFRGWTGTYEFAYRANYVGSIWDGNDVYAGDIGWDVAVPVSGFNVKTFTPNQVQATRDNYGQPLKHDATGKILTPFALPDGVAADVKARAMVLVHAYESGGASQLPSAQPIALNDDGTPRSDSANPKVLVRRYRPNQAINFTQTFGLRLD